MTGQTPKIRRQARTFGLAIAGRDKRQQRRLVRRMTKHYARIGAVLGLSAEEAYGMLWKTEQRIEFIRGEWLTKGYVDSLSEVQLLFRAQALAMPILNQPLKLIATGI